MRTLIALSCFMSLGCVSPSTGEKVNIYIAYCPFLLCLVLISFSKTWPVAMEPYMEATGAICWDVIALRWWSWIHKTALHCSLAFAERKTSCWILSGEFFFFLFWRRGRVRSQQVNILSPPVPSHYFDSVKKKRKKNNAAPASPASALYC